MFLRNAWYVCAFSHEVNRNPLGRILLNEPIVFFRRQDGGVVALEDRCSHRGFPLHKGRLVDDTLECGYHGLTFDCSGRCIRIPGQSEVPARAAIRAYPVIERWGLVWIWMGEAADADPRGIVDWHILGDGARDMRGEHLHVRCNYQLITDNLLDLSHISFVHPRTLGSAARLNEAQVENEITDDHVTTARWLPDIAPPPTYARFNFKGNVDRFQITTFNPPGFVKLFAGAAATGTVSDRRSFSSEGMAGDAARSRAGDVVGLYTFNAMTPETEHTTHYFWCISQDR